MPYTTEALNRTADRLHALELAAIHATSEAQDGHVYALCPCTDCNRTRLAHGQRGLTWQGLARTTAYRQTRTQH